MILNLGKINSLPPSQPETLYNSAIHIELRSFQIVQELPPSHGENEQPALGRFVLVVSSHMGLQLLNACCQSDN
jgi:hypothetical protein